MLLVLTKWTKNADDSIQWPDVTKFSTYSETNLPPGFTPELFLQYTDYARMVTENFDRDQVIWKSSVESGTGVAFDCRLFLSQADYDKFKGISRGNTGVIEQLQSDLLTVMKLTKEIKFVTNDETVIPMIGVDITFDQINELFNSTI